MAVQEELVFTLLGEFLDPLHYTLSGCLGAAPVASVQPTLDKHPNHPPSGQKYSNQMKKLAIHANATISRYILLYWLH